MGLGLTRIAGQALVDREAAGEVEVGTAKNSVLPILAATLLTKEPCRILDVPRLRDVGTMTRILGALGVECTREEDGSISTRVTDDTAVEASAPAVLALLPLGALAMLCKRHC